MVDLSIVMLVYQRVFQTISSQGGLPEVPEMVQSILTSSTSTASWAASLGRGNIGDGIHEESWVFSELSPFELPSLRC